MYISNIGWNLFPAGHCCHKSHSCLPGQSRKIWWQITFILG